jgi:hypothetical protein
MISFKELNNSLNEYNLVKLILNYSGKYNCLYDEFKRLSLKYGNIYKEEVYTNEKLSIDFIREFKDFLSWCYITSNIKELGFYNMDFLTEFKDYLHWDDIRDFPVKYINELQPIIDKISWSGILMEKSDYKLNKINTINKYYKYLNIQKIQQYICIFDNDINLHLFRLLKNKLNWTKIIYDLRYNKLLKDINFLKEFKNYIDYHTFNNWVSQDFRFTPEIIDIFKNKICWNDYTDYLLKKKKLDFKLFQKYKKYLNWDFISKNIKEDKFDIHFINKFKNNLNWFDILDTIIISQNFDKIHKSYSDYDSEEDDYDSEEDDSDSEEEENIKRYLSKEQRYKLIKHCQDKLCLSDIINKKNYNEYRKILNTKNKTFFDTIFSMKIDF